MKVDQIKKKVLGKTLAVTVFRATVLYLAYNHIITPRQNPLTREVQKSVWWSVKNAWKMSRLGVSLLRKGK